MPITLNGVEACPGSTLEFLFGLDVVGLFEGANLRLFIFTILGMLSFSVLGAKSPKSIDELELRFKGQMVEAYCCTKGWSYPRDPRLNEIYNCKKKDVEKRFSKASIEDYLVFCSQRPPEVIGMPTIPDIDTLILRGGEQITIRRSDILDRIEKMNPYLGVRWLGYAVKISCAHAQSKGPYSNHKVQQQYEALFLEINKCVPRTKIFEEYALRTEATQLYEMGKRDEAVALYKKGCDKGDFEACYQGALGVSMFGEKESALRLELLSRACKHKVPNSCETYDAWAPEFKKYQKDKSQFSRECRKGSDEACLSLITLLSHGTRRMNPAEAKQIATKQCEQGKAKFCEILKGMK